MPVSLANKIAAGEVVERPASVVKELVENAIDAKAESIKIAIQAGGRKLISVQDDGTGMEREDAVLSLERQATSKIIDDSDIDAITTLGFRGEAIPSIASVSRFSITTRRRDSDEGTLVKVNAGTLVEVAAAGCPPGTIVEVKDLFCNVPARLKFLRSQTTEENHIKTVFVQHALAHPEIAFSLSVDGREIYRLAKSSSARDRLADLFGGDLTADLEELDAAATPAAGVKISGFIERPNLSVPTRRDQYVFVNSRPASAPSIAYAIKEAYPSFNRDVKPAAVLFIELPAGEVDVNVHPTKREVRFRNNAKIKSAIMTAIERTLQKRQAPAPAAEEPATAAAPFESEKVFVCRPAASTAFGDSPPAPAEMPLPVREAAPIAMEFALEPDSESTSPWQWFKFLARTASGYLLIETDAGVVTVNPNAAHERIAFERLMKNLEQSANASQQLLIPEIIELPPVDFARIRSSLAEIRAMGFQIEEFGRDTFKVDGVPQVAGNIRTATVLATIAHDLGENGARRGSLKWKEELIAKSIARSFAGTEMKLDENSAVKLIEELASCKMPYVTPRAKPVMIFTSLSELKRKFALS
jgi:DNA mismatch repair protein MutL